MHLTYKYQVYVLISLKPTMLKGGRTDRQTLYRHLIEFRCTFALNPIKISTIALWVYP